MTQATIRRYSRVRRFARVVKHGAHDQKTHGRRSGGGGGASVSGSGTPIKGTGAGGAVTRKDTKKASAADLDATMASLVGEMNILNSRQMDTSSGYNKRYDRIARSQKAVREAQAGLTTIDQKMAAVREASRNALNHVETSQTPIDQYHPGRKRKGAGNLSGW